jgi:hypothetical protein
MLEAEEVGDSDPDGETEEESDEEFSWDELLIEDEDEEAMYCSE